jgi:uncharacterized membrane protein YeiH
MHCDEPASHGEVAVLLGMTTAGGVTREALLDRVPVILQRGIDEPERSAGRSAAILVCPDTDGDPRD